MVVVVCVWGGGGGWGEVISKLSVMLHQSLNDFIN